MRWKSCFISHVPFHDIPSVNLADIPTFNGYDQGFLQSSPLPITGSIARISKNTEEEERETWLDLDQIVLNSWPFTKPAPFIDLT